MTLRTIVDNVVALGVAQLISADVNGNMVHLRFRSHSGKSRTGCRLEFQPDGRFIHYVSSTDGDMRGFAFGKMVCERIRALPESNRDELFD